MPLRGSLVCTTAFSLRTTGAPHALTTSHHNAIIAGIAGIAAPRPPLHDRSAHPVHVAMSRPRLWCRLATNRCAVVHRYRLGQRLHAFWDQVCHQSPVFWMDFTSWVTGGKRMKLAKAIGMATKLGDTYYPWLNTQWHWGSSSLTHVLQLALHPALYAVCSAWLFACFAFLRLFIKTRI